MKYWRYETSERELTIYPLVCMHIGAAQCNSEFLKEHLARIKADPTARWLYLGDGGECVTKSSKGDVFSQTMNIQEQFNTLVTLLHPLREKGLFGVNGNHGNRVFKETGMSFDESLMLALQLPYMGASCFWHLAFKKGMGRISYDLFTHHGIDSGVAFGTKVNKAIHFDQLVVADAIFTAHSHICCEVSPTHIATLDVGNTAKEPIKWHTTRHYICGCAYDSRTGYAETKGYRPILPAYLAVKFRPAFCGNGKNQWIERRQTSQIWRAET